MPALPPTPPDEAPTAPAINAWATAFIVLFVWRYLRQVVHLASFWLYRCAAPLANPTITAANVTVIVPTVDPGNLKFREGLISVCRNLPHRVVVVTAGDALRRATAEIIEQIRSSEAFPAQCAGVLITAVAANLANKRVQVAHATQYVDTPFIALVDDHVVWKDTFLAYALPAFERDPRVGIVGTNKRVIREATHRSLWHRVLNMIQCLYLERHNFEIRSSNAVDGGVFVVSGRTSLVRAAILQDPDFLHGYVNDFFLFGLVGPLAVDDDNFLTRWCIAHHWRVKIQYRDETLIVTELGSATKFAGGLRRWVRTTWRSNSTSLASWTVWATQPWSVYAVYLSLFTNFALFYDPVLLYTFYRSDFLFKSGEHSATEVGVTLLPVLCWIVVFKMVKPFAYFRRHPQDLLLLPAYFLFTYLHSLIKLYALLTFYDAAWSGRNLSSINADISGPEDGAHAAPAGNNPPNGEQRVADEPSAGGSGEARNPDHRSDIPLDDLRPSANTPAVATSGPSPPPPAQGGSRTGPSSGAPLA